MKRRIIDRTLRERMTSYEQSLRLHNFSPLTINSYVSAANRFLDFVEEGTIKK